MVDLGKIYQVRGWPGGRVFGVLQVGKGIQVYLRKIKDSLVKVDGFGAGYPAAERRRIEAELAGLDAGNG